MENQIQKLRIQAGYKSAREFADKCGLKFSSYIHYETKKSRIPLENAVIIADTLKCSLDDLVDRQNIYPAKSNINQKIDDQDFVMRRYKMLEDNDKSSVDKIIIALSSLN